MLAEIPGGFSNIATRYPRAVGNSVRSPVIRVALDPETSNMSGRSGYREG